MIMAASEVLLERFDVILVRCGVIPSHVLHSFLATIRYQYEYVLVPCKVAAV